MDATRRYANHMSVWVMLIGMLFVVPAVFAQNAEPAADAAAEAPAAKPAPAVDETEDAENESIFQLILESGLTGLLFMAVLGLFSMFGATIAVERAMNTRRGVLIPSTFVDELKGLMGRDETQPETLRDLCSRYTAPIADVLRAGMLRCGRPLVEVEKSMEDAAAREMATVRGGIRPLSVIGSVAPLVGLLGTVLGMIIAFRTASQAGLGKGELMAEGIYMALLTTAGGLTIAIPMMLLAAFFNSKVEKLFREIDESMMETMPFFDRMEMRDGRGSKPALDSNPAATEQPAAAPDQQSQPEPAVAAGA